MLFKLIFSNHTHLGHLEDFFTLIRLLVKAAGHDVHFENMFGPNGCYIFLENLDVTDKDRLLALKQHGSEFILVATEFVTGDTYNLFHAEGASGIYSDREYWQKRFRAFADCCRYARAVWCATTDPEQLALYQQVAGDVPVIPLPFPHFSNYQRAPNFETKDIDYFFSGTLTTYRMAMLDVLTGQGSVYRGSPLIPNFIRGDYLARSKISLNIRQYEQWNFPSKLRYWYHLNNGSCLVSERCESACELDPYIITVPTETLADYLKSLLDSGQWRRLGADLCERFAAEQPAGPVAALLFDRTFAPR